ncbi:Vacuolar protein sorting-associated protein 21 [Spathaspora sp. JA1]|nr:Vacuolar protein sorting-associated protein 21 [Spathaspora sp. JA1]
MSEIGDSGISPPPYKIVLLGESSVGKTSLVQRFTSNTFDIHVANTIGAAFITKLYTSRTMKDRTVKFEIWDTAGQERYRSLTPMYYRNAKLALICFDLNNFEYTFNAAKYWIQQLELNNSGEPEENAVKIQLVGTKSDLVKPDPTKSAQEREIADREMGDRLMELSRSHSNIVGFERTSSKEGSSVADLFEDIVIHIDEDFFKTYYERARTEQDAEGGGPIGSILNARHAAATSGCC